MSSETQQILTTDGIPLSVSLKKAERKNKIKAFDVLGPAFIKYDSKIIKIHKYTESNSTFTYELKDGLLYLDEITPEGKKRMKANDYMRGLQ